jgi:hypothetical protein
MVFSNHTVKYMQHLLDVTRDILQHALTVSVIKPRNASMTRTKDNDKLSNSVGRTYGGDIND